MAAQAWPSICCRGFVVRTGRDCKACGGVTEIARGHSREPKISGRELGDRAVESSSAELGVSQ